MKTNEIKHCHYSENGVKELEEFMPKNAVDRINSEVFEELFEIDNEKYKKKEEYEKVRREVKKLF